MSLTLRRLNFVVSNRKSSFCSISHQHTSLNSDFSRRRISSKRVLQLHQHNALLQKAEEGASLYQTRRTMSFLTDLLKRKKKSEDEDIPEARTLPLFEEAPKELTEEEIMEKRNVSRLSPQHQRLVHGIMPVEEPYQWFHHTIRYKQKMFGKYGESSGVNPGIMWPTRQELEEKIEYENFCNPFTIEEIVEKKKMERQREKEFVEKRTKEVEANMRKLDAVKEDLFQRQQAKENEASAAKDRRDKLIEEVRRHFGYTVDPREERFQELLAKKEKEQKKSLKEARKQARQQYMVEKLQGKSASAKEKEAKPEKKKSDDDDDKD